MSSQEEVELKAGHPPAVKAGGMRVASRPHHTSSGDAAEKPDPQEQEEYADSGAKDEKSPVVVSGAVAKGDQDFPPEAIKQFHEKPVPTNTNKQAIHNPNRQLNMKIQQPRQ